MEEAAKQKFSGEEAELSPAQVAYIDRMFEQKGPVLVRIGKGKLTRFLSPEEYKRRGSKLPAT